MGKQSTPRWIDVAVYLRRNGKSLKYIAEQCESTMPTIRHHLLHELGQREYDRLADQSSRMKRWQDKKIARELNNGLKPGEVAAFLKIPVREVYNFKHHRMKKYMRLLDEEVERRFFNMRYWSDRGLDVPEDFKALIDNEIYPSP